MLVNGKHLRDILHNYCTNWLKVTSRRASIRISIFKICKAKSGIPEHGKKDT